ncbi:MAG: FAD-dependent oxidoreductase [Pseudomonadota bacterium]
MDKVIIVGGGQAAYSSASSLRQWGYDGQLVILGDEPAPPYQRPPLSKAFLLGEFPRERLFFRPESWYEDNRIDLLLGARAERIDLSDRSVTTTRGNRVSYERLIVATGSRASELPDLPSAEYANVHLLRSLADVEAIRNGLAEDGRILVVGGGYIGLEAAASLRKLGRMVTVVERARRLLERVTIAPVSDFYKRLHQGHGVDIRTATTVASWRIDGAVVNGAVLSDGKQLDVSAVLVGIGIQPNAELAEAAGLDVTDGIVVDEDARCSEPTVFAAGDCANRPLVHYQRRGRLESVHNALEQGKLAAAAMLRKPRPSVDLPWFWSDQFGIKLQIAGLPSSTDAVVLRGDPESHSFSVLTVKEGRVTSANTVGAPRDFIAAKQLIAARVQVDSALLADPAVALKDLVSAID